VQFVDVSRKRCWNLWSLFSCRSPTLTRSRTLTRSLQPRPRSFARDTKKQEHKNNVKRAENRGREDPRSVSGELCPALEWREEARRGGVGGGGRGAGGRRGGGGVPRFRRRASGAPRGVRDLVSAVEVV
jgi:hypothetical protein